MNGVPADRHLSRRRPRIAWEAMMVNPYYGIYQAERGKTAAELRAADAQLGDFAAEVAQLGPALATAVRAARRPLRRWPPASYPTTSDARW